MHVLICLWFDITYSNHLVTFYTSSLTTKTISHRRKFKITLDLTGGVPSCLGAVLVRLIGYMPHLIVIFLTSGDIIRLR